MFPVWCQVCIITFCIYLFIPIHNLFIPNLVNVYEKELLTETYSENYLDFHTDYERCNPLTRKSGFERYFQELNNAGELSNKDLKTILDELENNEFTYLEDYFKNNNTQSLLRENFEKKYYGKTIFQAYYDNFCKSTNYDNFLDKNYLFYFVNNNIFSAKRYRFNKKLSIRKNLYIERRNKEVEMLFNKTRSQLFNNNTNQINDNHSELNKNYDIPDHNQLELNEKNLSYNFNPKIKVNSSNNSKILLKIKNSNSNSRINDEV